MTIHKLRHNSATELISGGVDVRTIAGRLGHGGGGTTTLRVYAAWVSEAGRRAQQGEHRATAWSRSDHQRC
jgi:site-specific recombinase XerD